MNNNRWLYLVAGLFILIAIFFLVKCPDQDIKPLPIPPTILDTSRPKVTDSLKKAIKNIDTLFQQVMSESTPPDTYIDYIIVDSLKRAIKRIDTTKYLIIIDSLSRELARIHQLFITQAPTAPKLISGGFTGKSIALNLLKPDGRVTGNIYNVDYDKYTYMYDSLGMHTMPILKHSKIMEGGLRSEVYGYVDYDLWHKHTTVSADYLIIYRNYSAYTRIGLQLGPSVRAETKLGIRIKLK